MGGGQHCFTYFFLRGGHFRKYKVLVTGVKVISKKICWEQLVEGAGRMPRLFIYLFFLGGGDELHLYYEVGRTLFYLFFIFLQGEHCHKYKVLITGTKVPI